MAPKRKNVDVPASQEQQPMETSSESSEHEEGSDEENPKTTPSESAESEEEKEESKSEEGEESKAEEGEESKAKKPKNSLKNPKNAVKEKIETGDENKSAFKRLWSEKDELSILECYLRYRSDRGSPLSNKDDFHRYTATIVPRKVSQSQLFGKIRKLKNKFQKLSEKVNAKGEDRVFSKPNQAHARQLYQVSNNIWGVGGCENAVVKVEDDDENPPVDDFERLYPYWTAGLKEAFPCNVDLDLVKDQCISIGAAAGRDMEENWKAVFKEGVELKKRKIQLLNSGLSEVSSVAVGEVAQVKRSTKRNKLGKGKQPM